MGNLISDKCECFSEKIKPEQSRLNPKNSLSLTDRSHKSSNASIRPLETGSDSQRSNSKKVSIEDFSLIKVVGKGSYGKVFLVQHKATGKFHAMKKLDKAKIISEHLTESTITERQVLVNADHPFVVGLQYSFQSKTTLYMVMDYLVGGELFTHIKMKSRFNEEEGRFYAAEVILALQYLHEELDVMYRDLKPENILLDAQGHIKITDFGLAKAKQMAKEIAGTPEYLAPEIIQRKEYGKSVDWWTLGCLMYEMMVGRPPFQARDYKQLFYLIAMSEPKYPSFIGDTGKDLLQKLLTKNPERRLGHKGCREIKNHPFFACVDWKKVLYKKISPPIVPRTSKPDDVGNFDKRYLNQPVTETPSDPNLLRGHSRDFQGFTFAQDKLGPLNGDRVK